VDRERAMATEQRVSILPGNGDLPRALLTSPNGARAEVYLQGAHVTSWIPADGPPGGGERLFLSRTSEFRPGAAIRGGVPVVFPQFSDLGPLPPHGFARVMPWEFMGAREGDAGSLTARFQVRDSHATRQVWPQAFLAELEVTLGGARLELALRVTNTGDAPFEFTGALHSYLRVADVQRTIIEGLGETRYRERQNPLEGVQVEPELQLSGPIDRIYLDAPAEVTVREPARSTRVISAGFRDVVVWNPWAGRGAAIADLEPEGYRRMVCVEAAVIGAPARLEPAQRWQGAQMLVGS